MSLSEVKGHCVYASPSKITKPTRSFFLSFTKSIANSLEALNHMDQLEEMSSALEKSYELIDLLRQKEDHKEGVYAIV